MPALPPRTASAGRPSGTRVVFGVLGVGVAAAAFALLFQWRQTAGCLGFYGAAVARAITTAPHVEVWHLAAGKSSGRLIVLHRCDVSRAPGLVHLRRGLVEDANFDWSRADADRLPDAAWNVAIAFAPADGASPTAVLGLATGPGPEGLCVVGQAGRVGLGRLGRGLRTWLETACPAGDTGADSARRR